MGSLKPAAWLRTQPAKKLNRIKHVSKRYFFNVLSGLKRNICTINSLKNFTGNYKNERIDELEKVKKSIRVII